MHMSVALCEAMHGASVVHQKHRHVAKPQLSSCTLSNGRGLSLIKMIVLIPQVSHLVSPQCL